MNPDYEAITAPMIADRKEWFDYALSRPIRSEDVKGHYCIDGYTSKSSLLKEIQEILSAHGEDNHELIYRVNPAESDGSWACRFAVIKKERGNEVTN